MTSEQRIKDILKILDEKYPNPTISLKHINPYTLLVSVLLSAQCTDARVNQVTPHLFRLATTPADMIKIGVEKIKKIIQPCGLHINKSNAIYNLSKILLKKYNGEVPQRLEELEELPGVGHKTASVVLVQAFNIPTFPVDTHIHRLAYRWQLSNGKSVRQTEKDLKKIIPQHLWKKVHLQMIFFGREYCPAQRHIISLCPICSKLQQV